MTWLIILIERIKGEYSRFASGLLFLSSIPVRNRFEVPNVGVTITLGESGKLRPTQ